MMTSLHLIKKKKFVTWKFWFCITDGLIGRFPVKIGPHIFSFYLKQRGSDLCQQVAIFLAQ